MTEAAVNTEQRRNRSLRHSTPFLRLLRVILLLRRSPFDARSPTECSPSLVYDSDDRRGGDGGDGQPRGGRCRRSPGLAVRRPPSASLPAGPALSRSADEARDLVQDTFLRAARAPASVPAGASAEEAWLVRVLVNLCRDRWRQTANRERLDRATAPPAIESTDPEDALVARSVVWRALATLDPRRRAVLVMHELEGVAGRRHRAHAGRDLGDGALAPVEGPPSAGGGDPR